MKNITKIIFSFIILCMPFFAEAKEVTVNLFKGEGCPHCAAEEKYLKELEKTYGKELNVDIYEVWYDEENNKLLEKVKDVFGESSQGVPFTVIGNEYVMGYNDDISADIKEMIDKELSYENSINIVQLVKDGEEVKEEMLEKEEESSEKTIPLLGKIDAKDVSLPLVGAVIGVVDGFNPCAMWILLFLISMLLPMKDKKRKWVLGITFLVTSALCYALFMVAWLNIALTAMQTVLIRNIIAIIALLGAIINLRSFIKSNDSGCTVVKDSKRKKIFTKIKNVTKEKSFIIALIGIITLAFTVNLVELACSAGLPLLYTSILAMNDLSTLEYGFNIFIYILFFLIDDIVIFIIAMKTLEVTGVSTKYGKFSHLIGGILMLIIGILLILKPEWLMFGF